MFHRESSSLTTSQEEGDGNPKIVQFVLKSNRDYDENGESGKVRQKAGPEEAFQATENDDVSASGVMNTASSTTATTSKGDAPATTNAAAATAAAGTAAAAASVAASICGGICVGGACQLGAGAVATASGGSLLASLSSFAATTLATLIGGGAILAQIYSHNCPVCAKTGKSALKAIQKFHSDVDWVMVDGMDPENFPLVQEYNVDSIPHFVFLGTDGSIMGEAVGDVPEKLLLENTDALAHNKKVLPNPTFAKCDNAKKEIRNIQLNSALQKMKQAAKQAPGASILSE
eukprot:jgi/Bigna1/67085/fgenesh1_pg.3_\